MEKAKMSIIKLDKVFLVFPYTLSKIESRMRSILINQKQVLDGIAHFVNFYLVHLEFWNDMMAKYREYLKHL